MFSLIHKRMRGGKGFTLIELLVVIIIIAILAAIAIPTFLGQRHKAQDATAKSLVRNAMTAVESAYTDTRDFTAVAVADLTDIEPSINFSQVAGCAYLGAGAGLPLSQNDAVGVDLTIAADEYQVGTESESGKTFGVAVDKGDGGGNTWTIDGAADDW